jgi:putative nucleotidyltransferase with HDIG domain
MLPTTQFSVPQIKRQKALKFFVLVLSAIFILVILNAPISSRSGVYSIKVGDVAIQDIQSPRAVTFTSEYLSNIARLQARAAIPPVYLPVDPGIKKQQLEKLNDVLRYIGNVRDDAHATVELKTQDLSALQAVTLSQESIQRIISLSASRWASVQSEAFKVLDDALRVTIREDNIESTRRNIGSLVDVSFSTDQAELITELVTPLIVPNSLYSAELTEQAKSEAEEAVEPASRSFATGQLIVQHGQIVRAEDMEALQVLGLTGQDNRFDSFLGSVALVLVLSVIIVLYSTRRRANPLDDLRSVVLIALMFNLFFLLVRFAIPYRAIIPFIFPLAAFGLTMTIAFNLEISLVFSLVLSILSAYNLPGSLEVTIYYLLGGMTGILVLGRGRKIASFFWASIAISAANILVVLGFRLGDPTSDWVGLVTLGGAAITNGLASASVTLILQFVLSQILGITTALQLLEISRPDHPLLQYLLRNAAGTYQHSLQVANLAEQAADRINADSLLVRVGALYHDVGKAMNPQYFIENQAKGTENPHDEIEPALSAAIIIKHVPDGRDLAKKFRIPPRIIDFIMEHHGTRLTHFQFTRAVEKNGGKIDQVDLSHFRYPGPAPRSRETALIMLADGCEARARADLPKSEEEIKAIIKKVLDNAIREEQLIYTKLTLSDLNIISESFRNTLMGIYHQRIVYPEMPVIQEGESVI